VHRALDPATDTCLSQPWVNPSASDLNLAAAPQRNESGELIPGVRRGVAPEAATQLCSGALGAAAIPPWPPVTHILPARRVFGHPKPPEADVPQNLVPAAQLEGAL